MQKISGLWIAFFLMTVLFACSKKSTDEPAPTPPAAESFSFSELKVNGVFNGFTYTNINTTPVIKFSFSAPVDANTVNKSVSFKELGGKSIPFTTTFENNDKTMVVQPKSALGSLSKYEVAITTALLSQSKAHLLTAITVNLATAIDSTDKFPAISDEELLNKVQQQTFKYFWDFGHPVSGMARERNTSGDVVTTGGTGFGIMAIVTAINRGFINREQGLARMRKLVDFLKGKAKTFHGAFPHWLDGKSGDVVPFSPKDNGADLVETSYLMQGLLTARQYFNGTDNKETALRKDINSLWQAVEWNWFRKGDEKVLYWHWSPDYNWDMNMPIKGWNEALITYVLAASSPKYAITKEVYDNGWASNGAMKNGATYYGIPLPLGPPYGGPLFFAHYSFLGINPTHLTDVYADYNQQTTAHTLINYNYCKTNPKNFTGYSEAVWGLTASDDNVTGYLAHDPTTDDGVIAPTAALSSFPYTPVESMRALKFFYYKLGDKLFKDYGFIDAFNLTDVWFSDSYLAIDQGPIIIMIENYRSGLLWRLFMSCPEVKAGMHNIGFQSPDL